MVTSKRDARNSYCNEWSEKRQCNVADDLQSPVAVQSAGCIISRLPPGISDLMSLSAADLLNHLTLANVLGVIGFGLIAAWPLFRNRRPMLGGQAACAVSYSIHYALIGASTGAAMMLLSIVQIVVAWRDDRRWWEWGIYASTLPAMAWFMWSTWSGVISVGAAAGLAFSSVGRWQRSPAALRWLFLASGLSWVVHDVMAGSLYGLCGDALGIATLILGAWRDAGRNAEA